jgi:hypothetical protein
MKSYHSHVQPRYGDIGRSHRRLSKPVHPVRTSGDVRADDLPRKEGADKSTSRVAAPLTVVPALQEVHRRLATLRSVVLTASLALRFQRAEYDADIAETLQRCVSDELDRLMWRLNGVLGTGSGADAKERQP